MTEKMDNLFDNWSLVHCLLSLLITSVGLIKFIFKEDNLQTLYKILYEQIFPIAFPPHLMQSFIHFKLLVTLLILLFLSFKLT